MSHIEVLDMSFLEVQRLVEEYNDMNKVDEEESGTKANNKNKQPDWEKLSHLPGITIDTIKG